MRQHRGEHEGAARQVVRRRLLVLLLAFGLLFRLWMASTTDNADARTLTWGSAYAASGDVDPYRSIIENPLGDPIPLGGIRSLSLAQGYVGVAVGAVPLWIGEHAGLIDLGDPPDGRSYGLGEIFSYKLSYLLPEVLLLLCLWALYPEPRKRLLAITIWATTPLVFFTWGQGMPDTWTVVAILAGYLLLRRTEVAVDGSSALRRYVGVAAVISLGALGTKLLPLILFLPYLVLVSRDRRLDRLGRIAAWAAVPASLLVFAAPYLVSPYMRANIFTRFEFDMLNSGPGVQVGSALMPAQLSLLILIGATLWLISTRDTWRYLDAWIITAVLTIGAMSGVITHLLIWLLVPIFLLVRRDETAAVGVAVASGLAVAWHVLTYDWLSGVVAFAIDGVSTPIGGTWEWIHAHVPMDRTVGGAVSSLMLLAVGYGLYVLFRPGQIVVARRHLATACAASTVVMVVMLLAVPVIAAETGRSPWAFHHGAFPTDDVLEIPRGGGWISPEIRTDEVVSAATITIDRSSQPSLDELQLSLVDENDETVTSGQAPVWDLEPRSDLGPVRIDFDRAVDPEGTRLVIRRIVQGTPVAAAEVAGPVLNSPLTNLEAMRTAGGDLVPIVELRHPWGAEMAKRELAHLVEPQRLLGLPLLAVVLAAGLARLLTRVRIEGPLALESDVVEPIASVGDRPLTGSRS